MMKKPEWLEKEQLYKILFESDTPRGRAFDIVLMVVISLSILVSFIETIPSLAHTFRLLLEISEYLFTFFFTLEYIAASTAHHGPETMCSVSLASSTSWPHCRHICPISCQTRAT